MNLVPLLITLWDIFNIDAASFLKKTFFKIVLLKLETIWRNHFSVVQCRKLYTQDANIDWVSLFITFRGFFKCEAWKCFMSFGFVERHFSKMYYSKVRSSIELIWHHSIKKHLLLKKSNVDFVPFFITSRRFFKFEAWKCLIRWKTFFKNASLKSGTIWSAYFTPLNSARCSRLMRQISIEYNFSWLCRNFLRLMPKSALWV